jgi:hypothetical protein
MHWSARVPDPLVAHMVLEASSPSRPRVSRQVFSCNIPLPRHCKGITHRWDLESKCQQPVRSGQQFEAVSRLLMIACCGLPVWSCHAFTPCNTSIVACDCLTVRCLTSQSSSALVAQSVALRSSSRISGACHCTCLARACRQTQSSGHSRQYVGRYTVQKRTDLRGL